MFEIPSNMACKVSVPITYVRRETSPDFSKWIGPGWFIPSISLGFGAMTVAFAFVRTFSAACGVRFLLGLFEAGMLPGIAVGSPETLYLFRLANLSSTI